MMRIEPPGFFDPDFQLLNYTCENGCCEIVLHIRKEGKKKGENFFWTGWKTTKEATKWCSQSNSVCWLHRFFRFCVPRDLESSSRLIYPHLARVCNAVTFFKSKVFHFSSMFLRLFFKILECYFAALRWWQRNFQHSAVSAQGERHGKSLAMSCRESCDACLSNWGHVELGHQLWVEPPPSFPTFLI